MVIIVAVTNIKTITIFLLFKSIVVLSMMRSFE